MPDDLTPNSAADAADSQPETPPSQSAPGAAVNPREMWKLENVFQDSNIPDGPDDDAGVSNGDTEPQPAAATAKASDAKPAPSTDEGVKAADAPEPGKESESPANLSRRQREAAEKDARIAELEAKVSAVDPSVLREQLRQEILAEEAQKASLGQDVEQARADAERFARLKDVPDIHLSADDYQWREEQKELRAQYPSAERAIRADAERYIAERIQAVEAETNQTIAANWERIRSDITGQIDASAALPGVNKDAFKQPGVTWAQMAEAIHAAGAANKEAELSARVTKADAEVARLQKENADLQAQAFGGRRVPAVVGRSAGAAPNGQSFDPTQGWRGNISRAFDFESN